MGNAPDSIEADGKPTEVKKKLPVKRCSMGSLNMITGKNNGVYSKSTESEGTSEGDDANSQSVMEENFVRKNCEEVEEYVFLDLDAVVGLVDLPPNAPYVLSGLDTLNPILTIDDKWKLVGEYEETIGTCLIFSENDVAPVVHEETGPVDANLFTGVCIIDPNLPPVKQVTSIARLQKILKFRLLEEDDVQDATAEPPIASVSMDTPPAKSDVQS